MVLGWTGDTILGYSSPFDDSFKADFKNDLFRHII